MWGAQMGPGSPPPNHRARGAPGWQQVETQDVPQRGDPIPPVDLLALGVGPPAVADRHLPDARPGPRQACGQLGLDAEAVGDQRQRLHEVRPDHLVAGLHVGEVEVGEHVGEQRQEPVAHRVPEVQHPAGARLEARAVDGVGLVRPDGLQEGGILHRVVLQVGVLDHDHVPRGRLDPGPHRGALAHVLRLVDHLVKQALLIQLIEELAGTVPRRVVHRHDLHVERDLPHAPHRLLDGLLLVVGRHDHRHHELVPVGGEGLPPERPATPTQIHSAPACGRAWTDRCPGPLPPGSCSRPRR